MFGKENLLKTFLLSAVISLGGCSIYPVAQDTTGLTTYDIVRHVRCETRKSFAGFFLGVFANKENIDTPVYKGMTGRQVLEKIDKKALRYWEIDWNRAAPSLKHVWTYYGDTSASYDFTLDNSEVNTQSVTLDISRNLYSQTSKLPFTIRDDKTREVSRNFRSYDVMKELITSQKLVNYCEGVGGIENWRYPLAGDIDIHDLVQNFLNLNQSGNLYGPKETPTAPTMADTIQFTTKSQANADPLVYLRPVMKHFVPTDVQLNIDNYRQDYHKLIIVLSLPPEKGGFTTARLVANGQQPYGSHSNTQALGAIELDRQRTVASQDAFQQIGQTVTRIFP